MCGGVLIYTARAAVRATPAGASARDQIRNGPGGERALALSRYLTSRVCSG